MTGHVRALAVLQIVYSSMGLLLGIVVFMVFGGIATIVGFNASIDDSMVAVPVLTLIGGIASSVLILLSLPRLIAGIGLWKFQNWGRILTFVVSILGLIDFPVGTGLGIYALWVLTHRDTAPLFQQEMVVPAVQR
jgi:hypothetical protein